MLFDFFYNIYFKKRYKQSYKPLRDLLSESQYWSPEKMHEYQNDQLSKLSVAMNETDHYLKLVSDKGLTSLKLDNVSLIGPLEKETVKRHPEKLTNNSVKHYNIHRTSGTGGDPLAIRVGLEAEAYRTAGRKRFYEWWGIKPRDRNVLIWGRSRNPDNNRSLLSGIETAFSTTYKISVFDLSIESFPGYFKKIQRYKPKFFRGYVSALEQFADLCKYFGSDLKDLKLKGAIVTSEVLSKDQREKIGSVFGCPVINEYGANDGGLMAFECPSGNLHIFEESILFNTKSDGEVLLTDLHNYATPLVNYELGDRIRFREGICPCGRSLKIIEEIEGRTEDSILKSNGQLLNNAFFTYIIRDLYNSGYDNAFLKYRVVQRDKEFDFFYIRGNNFSFQVLDKIKAIMLSEIGEDIKISFKEVDEIKREESGKLRSFVREN